MTQGIDGITTATLSLALDAAALRQQAIAANIANANVPGYVPVRVNFAEQMEEARRTLRERGSVDEFAIAGVRAQLEQVTDASGQPGRVQIDVEMANLAENSVHFQTLARGLSRHFSILSTAVNDGRK